MWRSGGREGKNGSGGEEEVGRGQGVGLETSLRNLEYCGTHHGGRCRGGWAARERDTEYAASVSPLFGVDF